MLTVSFLVINLTSNDQLILNKPEFTLEELLEEEDLIQECKSLNGKLINLYETIFQCLSSYHCKSLPNMKTPIDNR